ncbi:LuxR C-terminal-related transcriptional regulator [Paenibacillus sp. BT-177]|uniref:LuxR C-terminal-related transcriptional regulator n=1 Tax=Paenibacillus sp. BT-177 TaxID=2986930 RepID=UPI0021F75311|nr:LuxR C-terminal-related transcriptional regulator [Paenibacillus sp. BT-177]
MNPLTSSLLLSTKISVPLKGIQSLTRQGLLYTLDHEPWRVASISAPAGSGKTTLVSQWLQHTKLKAGWISLDEWDNDLARFWLYIAYTLDQSCSPGLLERLDPLFQNVSQISKTNLVEAVIHELQSLSTTSVLILDDYHVITEPIVHESLAYLVQYLPDSVRLVIVSREEPPLPTAKWQLNGQCIMIGYNDLQFSAEEIVSFYTDIAKIPVSQTHTTRLASITEGWAAGLRLSSLSLTAHHNIESFIGDFSGKHKKVSDYLFSEVFEGLEPNLKRFLLYTSMLGRMNAEICHAITGQAEAANLLENLKKRHLFLIPLDDQNVWFRYHHLFSDFLQAELDRTEPGQMARQHFDASEAFAQANLLDEAIEHAILAKENMWAVSLLERQIFSVLQRGEFTTLLRWFNDLQESGAALPLRLSLIYAFVLIVPGHFDLAQQQLSIIQNAMLGMQQTDVHEELLTGIFFVRANLAFSTGDYENWFSYAEQITGNIPKDPIFYHFNYNMNEPFIRKTRFGLKGVLTLETERIAERIMGILRAHGWQDSPFHHYIVQSLAEGYYEWNRLDEAEQLLLQTERVARTGQIPGLFVPNRLTYAKLLLAQGKTLAAEEIIEEAIRFLEYTQNVQWISPLKACHACLDLQNGQLRQAKDVLIRLGINESKRPTIHKQLEYMVLVRFNVAQGKYEQALHILERLKPQGVRESCLVSITEISIMQALIEHQLEHHFAAYAYLEEALVNGMNNNYVRSFVDEGIPMQKLLKCYMSTQISKEKFTPYVTLLLEQFPSSLQVHGNPTASSLYDPLTPKELEVLRHVATGASNLEIAQALSLKVGSVKVYLNRIYGKLQVSSRTQALLKAQELNLI